MAIVLGLLTAVFFGSGDFAGGLATKRTSVINVVGFSHLIGLLGTLALIPFFANGFSWDALLIGAFAGAMGGIGVALLYRGLARGPMAVIAPLTAITSAAVPTAWGFLGGESLSLIGWAGVLLALIAIGLVSSPAESESAAVTGRAVGEALLAGACFGAMFIAFDAAPDDSAPWPVVGARLLTTTSLLGFMFLAMRDRIGTAATAKVPIFAAGLLDTGSNLLFLLATQLGDLSIVAVLSSLYPAFTVLLARFVLDERMSRVQLGGLVAAIVATTLIAVA